MRSLLLPKDLSQRYKKFYGRNLHFSHNKLVRSTKAKSSTLVFISKLKLSVKFEARSLQNIQSNHNVQTLRRLTVLDLTCNTSDSFDSL